MKEIGAIVLAAGASRRFGDDNKLFLTVDGEPLLRRTARIVAASGVGATLVVTGHDHARCREVLRGLDVTIMHNADWAAGMGRSIAVGVMALPPGLAGAFIVPADMAGFDARSMKRLAAVFASINASDPVYPVTPDGVQRNPVLWPSRSFPELATLTGEGGGKSMLAANTHARAVMFDDPRAFNDIDTHEDAAALGVTTTDG